MHDPFHARDTFETLAPAEWESIAFRPWKTPG